jgi:hypothetical protein
MTTHVKPNAAFNNIDGDKTQSTINIKIASIS